MRWFGKAHGAPYEADTERADTPEGERCFWCGEAILGDESGVLIPHMGRDGDPREMPYHYSCHFRGIVGGLNHLLKRCTCCGGGQPPDPDGMSKRAAAAMATAYWNFGFRGAKHLAERLGIGAEGLEAPDDDNAKGR